jgi:hypothetical protein
MTFIDWSNPDEMLGLLSEYVADQRHEASEDLARESFLAELSVGLNRLTDRLEAMSSEELVEGLRELHRSQAPEFRKDPVLVHVEACIEELERIQGDLD